MVAINCIQSHLYFDFGPAAEAMRAIGHRILCTLFMDANALTESVAVATSGKIIPPKSADNLRVGCLGHLLYVFNQSYINSFFLFHKFQSHAVAVNS